MPLTTERSRRGFLKGSAGTVGVLSLGGCLGSTGSSGQFPRDGQEVGLIIPYSAGGGTDTVTRGIAPYLTKYFQEEYDTNVNTLPRNVTGGGGVRALNEHYEREPAAEPIAISTGIILQKSIMGVGEAIFDPLDFVFTSIFELPSFTIATRNEVDVNNWDDMVAKAEEEGAWKVAGSGAGGQTDIVFTILSEETGIPVEDVQFPGTAEALNSVMRGEATYTVPVTGTSVPFLGDAPEDIKPIMVIDDTDPVIEYPDTPLAPDQGLPKWKDLRDLLVSPKFPVLPPGSSDDHAGIWETVFTAAASDSEFKEWAHNNNRPISTFGREEARNRMESKVETLEEYRSLLESLTQ